MEPDEARRHNTVRQLKGCLAHLRMGNRQLYLAEDHIQLVRSYSSNCRDVFANLQNLRAGIEETQKIITAEVQNIRHQMERPREIPPPFKGANLRTKLTPRQRDMQNRLGIKFETNSLPKIDTSGIKNDDSIPVVIPHTPYKRPKRARSKNTRKKEGKIAI